MKALSNGVRKQVKQFIRENKSAAYIINYLFYADYDENDVVRILTGRGFNAKREFVLETLKENFGIEME